MTEHLLDIRVERKTFAATTVALWLSTCGIGLTLIVDFTGAEVPNTFDTV